MEDVTHLVEECDNIVVAHCGGLVGHWKSLQTTSQYPADILLTWLGKVGDHRGYRVVPTAVLLGEPIDKGPNSSMSILGLCGYIG